MESSTAALLQAGRKTIVLGTRRSPLALVQTREVQKALQKVCPEIQFELKEMATTGDKILDVPLAQIGDKGLFTKELELALLRNEIDLAVHSLKDVPTRLPSGLVLGAVTEREDPHDALVLHAKHAGATLSSLPSGSLVGTSSLRRVAQLKRAHPHLQFKDVRGNLNTRLRKLDDGEYDALVLAVAGLTRLGLAQRVAQPIDYNVCMHAVGQGAYGIECRASDALLLRLLGSTIHSPRTASMCEAERAFLRELEGGCQVPVAVCSQLGPDELLTLRGAVLSLDGRVRVDGDEQGAAASAAEIGTRLALRLKQNGAAQVLAAIEAHARPTQQQQQQQTQK